MSSSVVGWPPSSRRNSATAATPPLLSLLACTSIPSAAAARNSTPDSTAGPPTACAVPAPGGRPGKKSPGRPGGLEGARRAGYRRRPDDTGQVRPPQSPHPQRRVGGVGPHGLPHDRGRVVAGVGLQPAGQRQAADRAASPGPRPAVPLPGGGGRGVPRRRPADPQRGHQKEGTGG